MAGILIKPSVLDPTTGIPRNLQPGEALNALISAIEATVQTNANAGSTVIGNVVYQSSADNYNLAEANASGTTNVLGLQIDTTVATGNTANIQTGGIFTFSSTAQVDAVAGTTGGFVAGTRYFLSNSSAGKITSTLPTTGYVVVIGVAIDSTTIKLKISEPYQL